MARSKSAQLTVGVVVLALGLVLLVTRFAPVSAAPAWLLGLGLAFSFLAIFQRSYGALVAGMILLGIGSGMVLADYGVAGLQARTWRMLALGFGFVGIFAVAVILQLNRHWWPLLVGAALLASAAAPFVRRLAFIPPSVEIAVRTWWPVALVVGGLVLVIHALRH
ncbi:MAG: hypothetical protein ACM3O7_08030 [Acidobacteriota bacterium]